MKPDEPTRIRRAGTSITPITFGMAGAIYTESCDTATRDESWLSAAFRMTPWTTRCEWRSDDLTVVTYQHVHEAKTRPGSFQLTIPTVGGIHGIVFGQFFGLPVESLEPRTPSKKFVSEYSRRGPSCFRELNGLWVAFIWDSVERHAHFARDCVGGQTLYAARLEGRIVFATDLRAFHTGGMLRTLDEEAIAQFLHYLYVPAPRTLAAGCIAVLPGHVLSFGTATQQHKYAAPRFVRGSKIKSPEHIVEEIERQLPAFEDTLLTAVADCVPQSGRIALALSGGKDSSVLAVVLSKICPDRVLAFTVGQGDERFNEAHDAARVCRALGIAHQYWVPTHTDLAQGLVDFTRVQDQPIGDPAALPYSLGISRLPEDCTVIIDGTGNDYYFGIPSSYKGLWRYKRRIQIQSLLGPLWPSFLKVLALGPMGARRLSQFWRRPVEESFVAWEGWSSVELTELFGRQVDFSDTYLWQLMHGPDSEDWLALQTEVIGGIWEPHAAFRKAVHFAQALGKSIRFPFTDNRIASLVQGLPEQLKYKDGINKVILREYMIRTLPPEIVTKPKSGFIFDLNQLFANPVFNWQDALDRAGLLRVLPTWSQASIEELSRRRQESPDDPRWQQRFYALCLLATILAMKDGYDPSTTDRGKHL